MKVAWRAHFELAKTTTLTKGAMMHSIHVAVTVLGSLAIFVMAQNWRIFVPPSSVNATLNSIAAFHCNGFAPVGLIWIVDGLTPHSIDWEDRGIIVNEIQNNTIYNSTLTIPATEVNNDAVILCGVIGMSLSDFATAILRVQGLLDPPPALDIVITENSTIKLTWEEPFTLDITGVDSDITDYLICINLTGCFNLSDTHHNIIGTTEYLLPYLCDPAEFNVSAWNGAGLGRTSTITFTPGNVNRPTRIENITENVSFEGGQPVVDLVVVEDGNCTDMFEVIFRYNSSELIPFPRMIPEVTEDGMPVLTFSSGIVEDETYNVTVMVVESPDDLMENTTLTTFAVQGEDITNRSGTINVTCFFAEGSIDLGCYVLLVVMRGEDKTYRLYRDNTTGTLAASASHAFHDLLPGTYQVILFDIEEDGSINLMERLYTKEVTLLPTPSPSYSSLASTATTSPGPSRTTVSPSRSPEIHDINQVAIVVSAALAIVTSIITVMVLIIVIAVWIQLRMKTSTLDARRQSSPIVYDNARYVTADQLVSFPVQTVGAAAVSPGYQERRTSSVSEEDTALSSQPVNSATKVPATGHRENDEEGYESAESEQDDFDDTEAHDGASVMAMHSRTAQYADLGELTKHTPRPKDQEAIQYSEVIPQKVLRTQSKTPVYHNATTTSITEQGPTLDSLVTQLSPVAHKWLELGEYLGVSETLLDETYTNINSNDECLKEMLGIWLRNHDGPPTWREVAEAHHKMGEYQLGEHIHQIHVTGMVGSPLYPPAVPPPPWPPRETPASVGGPGTSSTLV